MSAFYVLARRMIQGKHEAWRCVGKHDEFPAADRQSAYWYAKPAHEAQIVAAGALSKPEIDRYDAEIAARRARAQVLA